MKLKNIEVGDTVEVKKSILDVGINYTLEANDLCRVVEVESLAYEGDLTVSIQARGDTHWVSHKHLRKPRPKVNIGDEFIVTKSSVTDKALNVGCKRVVSRVNSNGSSTLDNDYVMTARKNGAFELCGLDVFLEKVDKQEQLTGSDLTRKMLADGETSVLCYIDDDSDYSALNYKFKRTVTGFSNGWFHTNSAASWKHAVPVEKEVELTGSDLCRAMLASGYKAVLCLVGDYEGEKVRYDAITKFCNNSKFESVCTFWTHAVPINNQGEPLTQAEAGL